MERLSNHESREVHYTRQAWEDLLVKIQSLKTREDIFFAASRNERKMTEYQAILDEAVILREQERLLLSSAHETALGENEIITIQRVMNEVDKELEEIQKELRDLM